MTADPDLSLSTKLAIDRTRLAYERTLMAWVRTAASLISFGFTIHKFFQFLHQGKEVEAARMGPRPFALMMIAIGLTALVLATIEHRRSLHAMRSEFGTVVPYSLATVIASLVAVLGVLGFFAVLVRQ